MGGRGAVMDINGLNRQSALPAEAPVVPLQKAAEKREIVQAVKAVNNAGILGEETELAFKQDLKTHRMLIQVINRKTREVISQYPPDYVLRLAEDLKGE
jgi:uncharacterized FlaG/YvyC family protein